MHLGSKNHQIWGEHVSQSSLCITGALGVANMKEKNKTTTPLHQLKKGVSVLRQS